MAVLYGEFPHSQGRAHGPTIAAMSTGRELNSDAALPTPGQDAHAPAQEHTPDQTSEQNPGQSFWTQAWNLLHLRAPNTCPVSREYEQYIETAAARLYKPENLGNIGKLEHQYDCQIHSVDDAVKYANLALAKIDDPFTKVMTPAEANLFKQEQAGVQKAIGIVSFNHGPSDAYQPMHAPLFVDEVYPGSPAEKAGIKAGERILQIDGHDTAALSPHQNWALIDGEIGTSVNLVIQDGANILHKDVVRAKVDIPVIEDKDLGHNIAYIKLSDFMADSGPAKMQEALKKYPNAKAFVIDMRNNLGGDVGHALAISSLFIKEGGVATISSRKVPQAGIIDYFSEQSRVDKLMASPRYDTNHIELTSSQITQTVNGQTSVGERPPYLIDGKPVVILTNGYTASAGEMFTGAVHDSGHATIIGERTYGKGIGQTYLINNMPAGTAEKVTSLHYSTPSGLWPGDAYKHRIGIKPDIEVKNSVDTVLMSADDKQLSTAVTFLTKKLSGHK